MKEPSILWWCRSVYGLLASVHSTHHPPPQVDWINRQSHLTGLGNFKRLLWSLSRQSSRLAAWWQVTSYKVQWSIEMQTRPNTRFLLLLLKVACSGRLSPKLLHQFDATVSTIWINLDLCGHWWIVCVYCSYGATFCKLEDIWKKKKELNSIPLPYLPWHHHTPFGWCSRYSSISTHHIKQFLKENPDAIPWTCCHLESKLLSWDLEGCTFLRSVHSCALWSFPFSLLPI